jgi:hypothetical protein
MSDQNQKIETIQRQTSQNLIREILRDALKTLPSDVNPMQFFEEFRKYLLNPNAYLGIHAYKFESLSELIFDAASEETGDQKMMIIIQAVHSHIVAIREEIKRNSAERNIQKKQKSKGTSEQ